MWHFQVAVTETAETRKQTRRARTLRNVPLTFIRKVRVLCKTRLIFPRINGPNVAF